MGLDRRAAGGWAEVQLFPHDRVAINAGFGTDGLRGALARTVARRGNRTAFGNVIFTLTPEIQASLEYRWLVDAARRRRRSHEPSRRLGDDLQVLIMRVCDARA